VTSESSRVLCIPFTLLSTRSDSATALLCNTDSRTLTDTTLFTIYEQYSTRQYGPPGALCLDVRVASCGLAWLFRACLPSGRRRQAQRVLLATVAVNIVDCYELQRTVYTLVCTFIYNAITFTPTRA